MSPITHRRILLIMLPTLLAACSNGERTRAKTPASTEGTPSTEDTASTGDTEDTEDTDPPQTGDTEDTAAPEDTGSTTDLPAFELWTETGLSDTFLLTFDTNLPASPADCLAIDATGVPCGDSDEDGLTDAWEDLLLQHLRPVVRLDEDEPLVDDAAAVLVQLGRVSPSSAEELFVPIVLAWSRDYGRCGLSAHHGDSERVALQVTRTSPTKAGISAVYTAAHEGEVTDQGHLWTADEMGQLERLTVDGSLHWVVYASEGKHASYGTAAACESASFVPCIEEDCAPDEVANPSDYDRLPDIWNMGEPEHPAWSNLADLGLPGEDPWSDQRFCGGLDRDDPCSSPLVEKLSETPF